MGNILRVIEHELFSAGTGTMMAVLVHMIFLSLLSFFTISFFARVIYFILFTSFIAILRYIKDLSIFPQILLERLLSNLLFVMMISWFAILIYEKVIKQDNEFVAISKGDPNILTIVLKISDYSITLALLLVLVYLLSITILMTIYRIVLILTEMAYRSINA